MSQSFPPASPAITPTAILVIEKDEMMRVLHAERALSDRFMSYILSRNIRIEEDLIDQLLPRIRKMFESLGISAQFVAKNSAEELESAARHAISQNQRLLLAMGGDGTFQALANGVFGADVVAGVLPAGAGNDFSAALGIPRDPLKAAEAVLRGRPRQADLLSARTADGRQRFYVGGGGVGLDAEAAGYASGSYRHLPGRIRYIASALRALVGYVPLDVQVEFPGSEQDPVSYAHPA